MKILILLLIVSTSLFAQNTENWDLTFKSEILSTYFTQKDLKIVIVYSGENKEELELAYKSFSNSLKNVKNIKSVLSNKMLGNTISLDDKSIVKRAGFLDVNFIIVMRIFKDEDKFSAVVSLYNKKGDLVTGIFSEKGIKLEARQVHHNAPTRKDDGTASSQSGTASSQSSTTPSQNKDSLTTLSDLKTEKTEKTENKETKKPEIKEAELEQDEKNRDVINEILKHKSKKNKKLTDKEKEFEENYLAFEEVTLIDIDTRKVINSWTNPILGKYEKQLSWVEFYKKAGRNDLANKYSSMRQKAWIFTGITLVSFASTYFFINSEGNIYTEEEINKAPKGSERRSEMESANFHSNNDFPTIEPMAWVLLGVGLASLATSAIMFNYQPVEVHELRKIADTYNKKLRKDLGLNQYSKSQEISFDYSITPYAGKNTGGLVLDVKF